MLFKSFNHCLIFRINVKNKNYTSMISFFKVFRYEREKKTLLKYFKYFTVT